DRPNAFSITLDQVVDTFTYRVEAGQAISDPYTITAVNPVELVADSPALTVTPPAYAQAPIETQKIKGLAHFPPLQHGQTASDFRFTEPAVSAKVFWNADGKQGKTQEHAVTLSADRRGGRVELPATTTGEFEYRIVLMAEHNIATKFHARKVGVIADLPPEI